MQFYHGSNRQWSNPKRPQVVGTNTESVNISGNTDGPKHESCSKAHIKTTRRLVVELGIGMVLFYTGWNWTQAVCTAGAVPQSRTSSQLPCSSVFPSGYTRGLCVKVLSEAVPCVTAQIVCLSYTLLLSFGFCVLFQKLYTNVFCCSPLIFGSI